MPAKNRNDGLPRLHFDGSNDPVAKVPYTLRLQRKDAHGKSTKVSTVRGRRV